MMKQNYNYEIERLSKERSPILYAAMIFLLCFASPYNASAQESSGQFPGGSVVVGYDNRACSGSLEGSIRYDSSTGTVEFCDGTNWARAGGGCAAPSDCSTPGDVCTDGSLFAGFINYDGSCEPLYVTNTNQSTGSQWKTSTGANDITTDSEFDGRANQQAVSPIANFPAFNTCDTLSLHSKTDWYLPARIELHLLWANSAAIDANAAANFVSTDYWSSTEHDTTNGRNTNFTNGVLNLASKTNSYDVRCVRRD